MAPPEGISEANDFDAASRNAVGDHATAEDSLGFAPYVEAIAAFLTSDATEPPLTISIEGEWGSGKSSFMLQLERAIAGPSRRAVFFKELPTALGGYTTPGSLWKAIAKARQQNPRPTIQFNAWRHDKQDALWAAFALSVSQRLRHRVGFVRGWWGDLRLFFMRLNGLRGWLELVLFLVSVLLLALSVAFFCHAIYPYLIVEPGQSPVSLKTALELAENIFDPFAGKGPSSIYDTLFTRETATHTTWGAVLVLAIAGLVKFHKQFKLPISVDLKKYLSTPDYQGHAAFIESFHEDFTRLVRAYAGNERIYIFIDDLDRCDVPRAAELMQAINLMISDAGKLVFILGMDREKVAAGITQKYKDLLPFLPEYSGGISPNQQPGSGSSPLSFGYSYLEKFIQLTFTLPVIAGRESLDKFLDAMLPKPAPPTSWGQITYYWKPKLTAWRSKLFPPKPKSRLASAFGPSVAPAPSPTPPPSAGPDAETLKTERRIRKIRVRIAQDSEGVRSLVSMVSTIFENNPRRLKQFVSTLRLSLALSSEQGILELDPEKTGVTPQQLGKFVALTMRYPDIRSALAENPNLLGELEGKARNWNPADPPLAQYWRWLHKKSVRETLLYGVREMQPADDSTPQPPNPYSLTGLDVSRLMSLLPKVPPPEPIQPVTAQPPESPFAANPTPFAAPTASRAYSAPPPAPAPVPTPDPTQAELQHRFNEFANEYAHIRGSQLAGGARTTNMTDLVKRVQTAIAEYSPQTAAVILSNQLEQNDNGNRIVALAIACERIRKENLNWLPNFLAEYRTPFEHFWTIRALLLHEKLIDQQTAGEIAETLDHLMPEIDKDPGRNKQADQLKALAESILQRASSKSKSTPQAMRFK